MALRKDEYIPVQRITMPIRRSAVSSARDHMSMKERNKTTIHGEKYESVPRKPDSRLVSKLRIRIIGWKRTCYDQKPVGGTVVNNRRVKISTKIIDTLVETALHVGMIGGAANERQI